MMLFKEHFQALGKGRILFKFPHLLSFWSFLFKWGLNDIGVRRYYILLKYFLFCLITQTNKCYWFYYGLPLPVNENFYKIVL